MTYYVASLRYDDVRLKIEIPGINTMKTDLTFFNNESGSTLLDRFRETLKDGDFDSHK